MPANAKFFELVRPLFGGRLTQAQVDGMIRIVEYGEEWEYSPEQLGVALANIKKETANWMEPIREGARRYGTNYSDASAKRAVASIHGKGIISTNYALPAGPFGQSYYGRGLIQITWWDNYRQFARLLGKELEEDPDLALEWDISLDIAFIGMRDGLFRKKNGKPMKFDSFDLTTREGIYQSREMVNGDKHKNYGGSKAIGYEIADDALVFIKALKASGVRTVSPAVSPKPVARPKVEAPKKKERTSWLSRLF